jgi:large subunit ribosomal protein L33
LLRRVTIPTSGSREISVAHYRGSRAVVRLVSSERTGTAYVTTKSRRNDPDRLVLRKYDPAVRRHVEFREAR